MGSKHWTWVLNLLKSFGSQILDLGLDSNKVMRASSVELGLQFKQSDVNLKPWAWALTHSKSGEPQTFALSFNSSKVVLVLSLGLETLIQSMS
jgi:hypothetical protein